MEHLHLRVARGLSYQDYAGVNENVFQDLLRVRADRIPKEETEIQILWAELIKTTEKVDNSTEDHVSVEAAMEQSKSRYKTSREQFVSQAPRFRSTQEYMTSPGWLDDALRFGFFDSSHQGLLRRVLEAGIINDDLASVTSILLSLMDDPKAKSLRYELVCLAQHAVNGRRLDVLKALIFYAIKPLGAQKDAGLSIVAAARANNTEALNILLESSIDPDARDHEGRTALMVAAAAGKMEAMETLLSFKADVEKPPPIGGLTALAAAVKVQNVRMVQLIVNKANVNPPYRSYGTPLQMAAAQGSLTIVDILVKSGAKINYPPPPKGRTALQAAAESGSIQCVEYLPRHGADVNAAPACDSFAALEAATLKGYIPTEKEQTISHLRAKPSEGGDISCGLTALQAATLGGHLEIFKLLIQHGAEVNAQAGHGGLTAIQAASMNGNLQLFDEICGTDHPVISHRSKSGFTSLQAAALKGHADIVERLLSRPETAANEQTPRGRGFTPPQAACIKPHLPIAERLLDEGADVHMPPSDHRGRTALQAAAESGSLPLVTLLIQAGADINSAAAQEYGVTALQGACRKGHLEVAKQLCLRGADVSARASVIGGRTALQAAVESGRQDLVTFLLNSGAFANELPAYIEGVTSIGAAAHGKLNDIMPLLIDAGADYNFLNHTSSDDTPVDDWSLQYRVDWIYDPILNVESIPSDHDDANPEATTIDAETPGSTSFPTTTDLSEAATLGDEVTVEFLLAGPAKHAINSAPAVLYGRSALQAAAEFAHDAVVAQLLHAGADPNGKPAEIGGFSALEAAAKGGYLAVVRRLLNAGSEVDGDTLVDETSRIDIRPTALQLAARSGYVSVVEELLANGAEINMGRRGIGGWTALEEALKEGWDDVVEFLKKKGATE